MSGRGYVGDLKPSYPQPSLSFLASPTGSSRDPISWVLQLLQSTDIPPAEIQAGEESDARTMVRMNDLEELWRDLVRCLEADHSMLISNPAHALEGALLIR